MGRRAAGRARPMQLFVRLLFGGQLDGDTRIVMFANGMVSRERILDIDDQHKRVAYTVSGWPRVRLFHHASMEVVEDGPVRSSLPLDHHFLPKGQAAEALGRPIEQGGQALKANLEQGWFGAARPRDSPIGWQWAARSCSR